MQLRSKQKNLDQSSLLIFSIFLSPDGFALRPTYILYQFISSFRVPNILYRFPPVCRRAGVSSLQVIYEIFRYGDEGTWQRHLAEYSQHKIVEPCPSSMSQTSCSLHGGRIHTHTHTHTYTGAFIVNFEYVCWNRNSGNTVKHECELHTECDQLSSPYKLEKQSFRGVL